MYAIGFHHRETTKIGRLDACGPDFQRCGYFLATGGFNIVGVDAGNALIGQYLHTNVFQLSMCASGYAFR